MQGLTSLMTVDLPDSPANTYDHRRMFASNISAVVENSIDPELFWKFGYTCNSVELNIKRRFNPGLAKQNKVIPNCQISTLSKFSCFAYLM